MGTITLSLPDALKEEMSKVDWVNWSSIARAAFEERLSDVRAVELRKRRLEELKALSESPEEKAMVEWSVELGRKSKKGRWERILEGMSAEEKKKLGL